MQTRANELFDEYRRRAVTTSSALLKACILIEEQEKAIAQLRADLEREVNTSREKSYVILNLEEKLKSLRVENTSLQHRAVAAECAHESANLLLVQTEEERDALHELLEHMPFCPYCNTKAWLAKDKGEVIDVYVDHREDCPVCKKLKERRS